MYYILSGLGADHKIFENLKLPEPHRHIAWIDNLPRESLTSYATRMAEQIEGDNAVIIGLSFGGIVAQEIAKIKPIKSLILISTIKSKEEKPWYINLSGRLRIPLLAPNWLITNGNFIFYWFFSAKSKQLKQLLDEYFENAKPNHLRWAAQHIATWDNKSNECKTIHIHGKGDRVLPSKNLKDAHLVEGGHLACFTHADQFSELMKLKLTPATQSFQE